MTDPVIQSDAAVACDVYDAVKGTELYAMRKAALLIAAHRKNYVDAETERVVGLFEALCKGSEVVAGVAKWIREGEQ